MGDNVNNNGNAGSSPAVPPALINTSATKETQAYFERLAKKPHIASPLKPFAAVVADSSIWYRIIKWVKDFLAKFNINVLDNFEKELVVSVIAACRKTLQERGYLSGENPLAIDVQINASGKIAEFLQVSSPEKMMEAGFFSGANYKKLNVLIKEAEMEMPSKKGREL